MPVVGFELKGTYIGSNGMGADVYALQPDNMPCLVPNSSFHYNMPVTGQTKHPPSFKADAGEEKKNK